MDTKTYDVAETITYNGDNARSTDVATAENKLDDANGGLTYLSRADGFANYEEATKAPTNFTMSDENKQAFKNNSNYNPEDYNDASDEMPTTGASNGMKLADLPWKRLR